MNIDEREIKLNRKLKKQNNIMIAKIMNIATM